jgi:O-antigen/teichoic acid export membrane protein
MSISAIRKGPLQLKIKDALLRSNLLWYGATASLVSGTPILLLPFLLNRLPAGAYAQAVSMQIIAMFGGLLITLGFDGSVARDALRARPRHLAAHVVIVLSTQAVMFALLSLVGLIFAHRLEEWIDYPARRLWPTLLGCFLQQITLFTANLMRLLGRVRAYAALSVAQAVLEISLSLALLYTVVPGWEARLWGFLTASGITASAAIVLLWSQGLVRRPRYINRVLRRMLNYGLPTLPHAVFSLMSAWADRFLLIRFCGIGVAGIYAAAGQSIFVINFVGSVANLAWTPWLYRHLSAKPTLNENRPRIARITYLLAGLLVAAGVIILGCLSAYFRWAAPVAYRKAVPLLPLLALGAISNAVYKVATNYLFFYGKTRFLAAVAFAILVISLAAQWLFVPIYQGMASAAIFALINIIQLACTWFMAARLFRFGSPLHAFRY